uniref:Transcription elongation factor A protein-like 3 n=1 Tax=Moschus moschiferus TaxID=68415 RepID=A0A8C6CJB6_MOSMO
MRRARIRKGTLAHGPCSPSLVSCLSAGLHVCSQHSARLEKEKEPGKLESEGKPEDEVEPENEGKSDEKEKPEVEGKSEQELQNEGQPDNERQPADEGKQEKQGKFEAKSESQLHAAEKRPAEDYVPQKAKRKTDRTTEDFPKDYQDNSLERHLGGEEMLRECGDLSKAQLEGQRKKKMGGFHWIQRDVQDPLTPRGQQGVKGMRGGGRSQRGLHDIPYL